MTSKNDFYNLERKEFRDRLNYFLHPSGNISLPNQLKGRVRQMKQMLDCFETPGSHAFIWGPRGVGKTSLGHTACAEFKEQVSLTAAIACEKTTSFSSLINDLFRSVFHNNKVILRDKAVKGSLGLSGLTLSVEAGGIKEAIEIDSPNHAVALLNTIFAKKFFPYETPTVIIDEFDRLDNKQTFEMLSSVLKQLSVEGLDLQFVFCGVAKNLDELLGAHESVERYVYGVELPPLSHDAIWEIISDVEEEFGVTFHRGQRIRISQIAGGYAGFAHLILKNILMAAFDAGFEDQEITESLFKSGIHESAQQAATRLKTAYDNAIKRGTDRYIEVLWALANDEHFDRQFKSIVADYKKIMELRPHREPYDVEKANGQDLRNALNNLSERGFLKKGKTGWYEFVDPMLRSYVRLVAEREGVELSDENFPT
jgi:Cdc6-like AAA superfamily ATPase